MRLRFIPQVQPCVAAREAGEISAALDRAYLPLCAGAEIGPGCPLVGQGSVSLWSSQASGLCCKSKLGYMGLYSVVTLNRGTSYEIIWKKEEESRAVIAVNRFLCVSRINRIRLRLCCLKACFGFVHLFKKCFKF